MRDARTLTQSAQEALRIRAVEAVLRGESQKSAAEHAGVTAQTVSEWMRLYKLGG